MKRYPRPDAIITDRLRSYRAALRELGGSDASRNSPPSILSSTTTSTCDDPAAHGTISSSTAPLHLPSGVNSGGLIPCRQWRTQTCDFTLTVPFRRLRWRSTLRKKSSKPLCACATSNSSKTSPSDTPMPTQRVSLPTSIAT